jgi:hypothetical protein
VLVPYFNSAELFLTTPMCTTTDVTKPTSQPLSESQSGPQPVVIIAKHLCGVATDLAIHSARSFPHIPRSAVGKTANPVLCLDCLWVLYAYLRRRAALPIEDLVPDCASVGPKNSCRALCNLASFHVVFRFAYW